MKRVLVGAARSVARHERAAAALLTGIAVLAGLHALRPESTRLVAVLGAAHQLSAGTVLSARDLEVLHLPPAAVPVGALTDLATAAGQTIAGPMAAREVVTSARLLGPALLTGVGTVAVPVRIADAGAAALVRDGDHIDLLAVPSQGGRSTTVASDVVVLSSPPAGDAGFGDGALVVVAATPAVASALASAEVAGRISLVLRGR